MATTNGDDTPAAVAAITTDVASFGPNVHISKHPVLSHKISVLRSSSTSPGESRRALREITFHLGYEATSTLTTKPVALNVPLGHDHIDSTGNKIAERIAIVPILRSGLGMTESMLELLPNAGVHHIGMYRQNLMPVQYYNRLPKKCESDVAYVLDPVMATGNTIMSVVKMLKKVRMKKWIHSAETIASFESISCANIYYCNLFRRDAVGRSQDSRPERHCQPRWSEEAG